VVDCGGEETEIWSGSTTPGGRDDRTLSCSSVVRSDGRARRRHVRAWM
jgi:hypothetical protein